MNTRPCPFPGLLPFQEKDAPFFFGRDRETAELLRRLEQSRFVAVIGVSGSGKSSLVHAGLKPELRFGELPWRTVEMKPGDGPRRRFQSVLETGAPSARWSELLGKSSYGLVDGVRDARLEAGEKILVIVDQFEEIFSYRIKGHAQAEEADLFVQQLLRASTEPGVPVYVLLTMRTDYLGHCALFRNLPEALNEGTYLVPRLTRHEQEEAIRSPLAVSGVEIEPEVVDLLLNAAEANRDELPVLQHLMKRLWEEWAARGDAGKVRRADLEKTGRWDEAIARDAEFVLARLTADDQEAAKLVFQRITEKGTGERPIRTPCSLAELTELTRPLVPLERLREILAAFRARDLLVWESKERIDIPHECVTWRWNKLASWIEEEDRDVRRLRFVAESAREGTPLAGSALEEARALRRRIAGPWVGRYNLAPGELTRWIDYSEREAARARRRTQNVVLGLGLATLFLLLGLWAWWQKSVAEEGRWDAQRHALEAVVGRNQAEKQRKRAETAEQDAREYLAAAQGSQREAEAAAAEARATAEQARKERRRAEAAEEEAKKNLAVAKINRQQAETAAAESRANAEQARAQSNIALVRLLASRSNLMRADDPGGLEKATLLAAESMRLPTFEGDLALRRGLRLLPKTCWVLTHQRGVSRVAFSPDGKWVATGSEDNTARVIEAATGHEVSRLVHQGPVWAVAFSPDGKWVATGSNDHTARVIEAATGHEVSRLVHQGPVRAVAFSPDGKWVATGSNDHTALVMEVATGKEVSRLAHQGSVTAVAFSPGGKWVATGSEDKTARVMDVATGKEVSRLAHQGPVRAVAFSPDGKWVATGSEDKTVRVMEVATGKEVSRLVHQGPVRAVAFSPDGKWVATGSEDNTARVMEAATGNAASRLAHQGSVTAVAFSPDGEWVATGSDDHGARVMEAATGKEVSRLGHQGPVRAVAFSPDGKWVATGSEDNTVRVMEPATAKEVSRLAPQGPLRLVAVSPDLKWVATGSDVSVQVMEAATGNEVSRLVIRREPPPNAVAFSPDSKWVATVTGTEIGTALLMEVATGKVLELPIGTADSWVEGVAFSPDSKWVATGSNDHTALVMEVATGRQVSRLEQQGSRALAFSPDGKWLATASSTRGTVRVMEVATGKEVSQFEDQRSGALAFSPDGKWLFTGRDVLEVATGNQVSHLAQVRGHGVVFSPDGKWLASVVDNNTVWVIEAATGQELHGIDLPGPALKIRFSPDRRWLEVLSTGFVYSRHPLDVRELLHAVCEKATRNLTAEEWKQYAGPEIPYRRTCENLPFPPDYRAVASK